MTVQGSIYTYIGCQKMICHQMNIKTSEWYADTETECGNSYYSKFVIVGNHTDMLIRGNSGTSFSVTGITKNTRPTRYNLEISCAHMRLLWTSCMKIRNKQEPLGRTYDAYLIMYCLSAVTRLYIIIYTVWVFLCIISKVLVFRIVIPCELVGGYQRFGGAHCLRL
jgi:hypothetical protein